MILSLFDDAVIRPEIDSSLPFSNTMHSGILCLLSVLALVTVSGAAPLQIRVATYNASLNRSSQGQLVTDLSTTTNAQAKKVAEILQLIRPDIVLINEFDYDAQGRAAALFHDNYLAVAQNGRTPLSYPYRYAPPSNTGVASGFDLDNNGFANTAVPSPTASTTTKDRYGNDCFGFGWFPGQYGFVVYSKFPIQTVAIRTFQLFKWKDMPGAALPDDANTGAPGDWYSAAELNVLRLSSKNHCDVPIELAPGQIVNLLASHPTPPSFDGAEDRNGRRNHDEIRLWADYLSNADYIRDDAGGSGGLAGEQRFIVLGDMNADPFDGDSFQGAINQLRNHPLVNATFNPASAGGVQQATGGVNLAQHGDPAFDTSDFNDFTVGNLRVDHVLPSKAGLNPVGGGVFWPAASDPNYPLLFTSGTTQVSDHRLVYLDLAVVPIVSQAVRGLSVARQGGDVVLEWGAQGGVSYRVEQSSDLSEWTTASQMPVALDPATMTATASDRGVGDSCKFYRITASLDAPMPTFPGTTSIERKAIINPQRKRARTVAK